MGLFFRENNVFRIFPSTYQDGSAIGNVIDGFLNRVEIGDSCLTNADVICVAIAVIIESIVDLFCVWIDFVIVVIAIVVVGKAISIRIDGPPVSLASIAIAIAIATIDLIGVSIIGTVGDRAIINGGLNGINRLKSPS